MFSRVFAFICVTLVASFSLFLRFCVYFFYIFNFTNCFVMFPGSSLHFLTFYSDFIFDL